jgi:hypothetical protein
MSQEENENEQTKSEKELLEELFDNTTEISTTFRNRVLICTFEFPDRKDWLEYLRRSANFQARNKKVIATEDALSARLWVFQHWCKKVEVENGDKRVNVPDLKKVPYIVQEQAATAFLSQVSINEGDEKNS